MQTLRRPAPFELKEIGADGQFVGLASVYGNVDLGGDIVQRGAFVKTLRERGPKRTLKYMHKDPIGAADLADSEEGLVATGFLNLDLPKAQEVYSNLQFWKSHGMTAGMSIGYIPNDQEPRGRVRLLKDVSLLEVTVTDPDAQMNPEAGVFTVKSLEADEELILLALRELKNGDGAAADKLRALLATAGLATVSEGAAQKDIGPVFDHSLLHEIQTLLNR